MWQEHTRLEDLELVQHELADVGHASGNVVDQRMTDECENWPHTASVDEICRPVDADPIPCFHFPTTFMSEGVAWYDPVVVCDVSQWIIASSVDSTFATISKAGADGTHVPQQSSGAYVVNGQVNVPLQ
jgi:hypothetical protein